MILPPLVFPAYSQTHTHTERERERQRYIKKKKERKKQHLDRHSAKHTHTYRQSDIMKKKEREGIFCKIFLSMIKFENPELK